MRGGASGGPLAAALERVRAGLEPVRASLAADDMPVPTWSGKLIRPLVGWAAADRERSGGALWSALAAVQLAHEASLLHDDVIDGADERRGAPTVAASRGVAAALVEGDHLLTASYRLAMAAGSPAWAARFARAVERTVAGEKAQARSAGRTLDWASYEAIVLGKSGELLGAALAAGPDLRDDPDADALYELGRRIGLVYQMLDDLLDYCPGADTGKPALGDYARGLWTWPRLYADLPPGLEPDEVGRRLRRPGADGVAPLDRCLARLRSEAAGVAARAVRLLPGDDLVPALLSHWLDLADAAAGPFAGEVRLPVVDGWERLMDEHAKSFRFAARLFPARVRETVAGIYAWCRYTDELVDGAELPRWELEARLDAWLALSRRAYRGSRTGNPLADRVMTDMREAGVPFGYAAELVEGMRMDVRGTEYGTLTELWTYTFRVASVVGLWMTERLGIRDPWMLDRAASLGHAMQLTNILRDVGEDLDAGRVYLPAAWLAAHGLSRDDLVRMRRTGVIEPAYRALVEGLMAVAEAEYRHAEPAIARLPAFYRRPVAVAAHVYRGIHQAIRDHGYDNLTRRAHTSMADKLRLGAGALWRIRRPADRTPAPAEQDPAPMQRAPAPPTRRLAATSLVAAGVWLAGVAPASAQAGTPLPPGAAALDPRTLSVETPVEPRLGGREGRPLDAMATLWVLAVDDAAAVDAGLEAVARLRARLDRADPGVPPAAVDPTGGTDARAAGVRVLRAYEGAFLALRARHGHWPPARIRDLRRGLDLLDAAVAGAPDAALPRYLRLRTDHGLPGVFGRGDEADDDLAALARLLPEAAPDFPPVLLPGAVAFVLEHGELDAGARLRLEAL